MPAHLVATSRPAVVSHARRDGDSLRILHVVEAFGGGIFEVVRLITSDSLERGHRVAVAFGVRRETPDHPQNQLHSDLELIPTSWNRRSIVSNVRARFDIRRVLAEWKPDLVHVHSSFAGVVVASSSIPLHVPVIYTPHAYSFEMRDQGFVRRQLFRLLEAYVSRRVTIVAAVSHDEARLARSALRAPRVTVIENGIPELDREVPERRRTRAPHLTVAMGRISAQRQPAACARILAAVKPATETRWIGGGTPDSPDLHRLQDAKISVTGWSSREEALAQLDQAVVYLHWTAWDGSPLSVFEAIARDVLVVAHDIPALREILDERQLCRNEDEGIELILEVLRDNELRSHLLSLQRRRAPRYQARRMRAEWNDLYTKVAAQAQASQSSAREPAAHHP